MAAREYFVTGLQWQLAHNAGWGRETDARKTFSEHMATALEVVREIDSVLVARGEKSFWNDGSANSHTKGQTNHGQLD
jgi:hypothetical protein